MPPTFYSATLASYNIPFFSEIGYSLMQTHELFYIYS